MRLTFCVACGSQEELQDHRLVPFAEGGGDEPRNLITLCRDCHFLLLGRRGNGAYGVKRQHERKRWLGGPRPFGFTIAADGALEPDLAEQAAIVVIQELYRTGLSLRAISADMKRRGVTISHTGVAKLVTGERSFDNCSRPSGARAR